MQKQIQEAQQKINQIFESLQFIINQSADNNIEVQIKETRILLFFGFQHLEVDGLYAHFKQTRVISQNEYVKIMKLQYSKKDFYLINMPYSLEGINNKQLCLKQCVTRIIVNKILLQQINCQYHIILNFQNLPGQNQEEKLNQITDFGLFNFGKLKFKNEYVSLIHNINNAQEISYQIFKDNKKDVQDLKHVLKEQTLRLLLQKDIFYKIHHEKLEDYGPMSFYFLEIMENYVVQIVKIIRNYQDQLLCLQQIPNLQDEQDLNNAIILLVRSLNQFFKNKTDSNLEFTAYMFKILNFINQQHLEKINKCLQKINIRMLESFLKDQEISIEQILIPNILVKYEQIEFINQMLKQFITIQFDLKILREINNLRLNIKCWSSYVSLMVESIIENFKLIISHIQVGPEQERENGVFLFGKSRVGKSTIINLLKNPESLTIEHKIDDLCYIIKPQYQTEFKIEHGCMSETQKITSMQIEDIFFYDCPGFDDNISQYMRIAHRISLYNYLAKTKKVIGFFIIDSSIKDAQIIKDTIDPIYLLLQHKNQIIKENNKWASLVLVKTKQNTRKNYIENWNEAYLGLLEGKYTFYREMYENDSQCIEFPQPKLNSSEEEILGQNISIQKKMLNRINENTKNNEFKLNLELQIESKLFYLYETVLSILQIKIQQIVDLLANQITTYILEEYDTLEEKKKLIQNFSLCIQDYINQENVKNVLSQILEWCKSNDRFKTNSLFIQRAINDTLQCLKIDDYCKNKKIIQIQVDLSILKSNADAIIKIIQKIEKIDLGLKVGLVLLSTTSIVITLGVVIVAAGLIGAAAKEIFAEKIAKEIAIMYTITKEGGAGGPKTSKVDFIIFSLRQSLLKLKYESHLKEQQEKIKKT